MNSKQTESETKVCELTAKLEELTNKESTIAVSPSAPLSSSNGHWQLGHF